MHLLWGSRYLSATTLSLTRWNEFCSQDKMMTIYTSHYFIFIYPGALSFFYLLLAEWQNFCMWTYVNALLISVHLNTKAYAGNVRKMYRFPLVCAVILHYHTTLRPSLLTMQAGRKWAAHKCFQFSMKCNESKTLQLSVYPLGWKLSTNKPDWWWDKEGKVKGRKREVKIHAWVTNCAQHLT